MSKLNLHQADIESLDGTPIRLVYDYDADILEIFFGENEPATGIELTDQILLRLNVNTERAVSLTILDFSILTECTEYGPRSYRLDKLDEIPVEMRQLVLHLLTKSPVSQFLKLSHFQASPTEQVPFTYVERQPLLAAA